MDGIQGAILNVKMNYIEAWTEGAPVSGRATMIALLAKLSLPTARAACAQPACLSCLCRRSCRAATRCRRALQAAGIGVGIHYPVPVHLQKAYADLGYRAGDFPVTETLADQFLSLPIYPELRPEQVAEVVTELEKVAFVEAA